MQHPSRQPQQKLQARLWIYSSSLRPTPAAAAAAAAAAAVSQANVSRRSLNRVRNMEHLKAISIVNKDTGNYTRLAHSSAFAYLCNLAEAAVESRTEYA